MRIIRNGDSLFDVMRILSTSNQIVDLFYIL